MNSEYSGTSDGDSFLDYYKGKTDGRNGVGSGPNSRKHSLSEHTSFDDLDDSGWIHRDKLAKIESRELEEAGLRYGRHTSGSRSNSRSTSRRRRENETHIENGYSEVLPEHATGRDQLRILPSSEEDFTEEEDHIRHKQHTPRDIAAEPAQSFQNRETSAARPGTSRIPLPKNSAAPVPSAHIERDLPLTRSRNNSLGNSLEDAVAISKIRARSQSGASQGILGDSYYSNKQQYENAVIDGSASPPRSSPSKAKVPTKATPTSGARKTTGTRATSTPQKKQRAGSTPNRDSPSKRPVSSGTPSRPSTSYNRPEGEAPWIATMYKPDPRLPPDQQMLPTHAKRMMQEQWEKEGKTGALYDKDFRLLTPHEFVPPKSPSPHNDPSIDDEDDDQPTSIDGEPQGHSPQIPQPAWPLATKKLEADVPSNRPSTSGTEHGGYRITPTVQSPPLSPSVQQQHQQQHQQQQQKQQQQQQRSMGSGGENTRQSEMTRAPRVTRMPEAPEEKEEVKKKGACACCVIM